MGRKAAVCMEHGIRVSTKYRSWSTFQWLSANNDSPCVEPTSHMKVIRAHLPPRSLPGLSACDFRVTSAQGRFDVMVRCNVENHPSGYYTSYSRFRPSSRPKVTSLVPIIRHLLLQKSLSTMISPRCIGF